MRNVRDIKKRIAAAAAAMLMVTAAGCAETGTASNTSDKAGGKTAQNGQVHKPANEVSKGRYVEENVSAEGLNRVTEFANSDDHCFVDTSYQQNGSKCGLFGYKDGGFAVEGLPADIDPDNVYEAVAGPGGAMFCSLFTETGELDYCLITKDGTVKKLDFSKGEELLDAFEFASDGRLFLLDTAGELYELNTEKMQLTRLCTFESCPSKIDIAGDIVYGSGVGAIQAYDIAKGCTVDVGSALESLWAECITEIETNSYDIFAGGENELYLVCPGGIYRCTQGGSITEQIVDGLYTDLSSSDKQPCFGAVDSDGSFLISFLDSTIKRYRYDPEAVNEFISELKIYSLKNSKTLSQAVSVFAKKHPEIKLVLEIGMKSGMTYEDAAKNLTAEIMSGKAPDLLMLDGLDTESFEAKGMLLDISGMADKWKPDDELFDNICEWNSEGGLYSVATRFGVPVLIGRTDKIDGIESYSDIAKLIEERWSSGQGTERSEEFQPESFARVAVGRMTELYGSKMIKDGKPDEALIRELLESTKRINDLPENGNYSFEDDYIPVCAFNAGIMAGTDLQWYSEEVCYNKESLNILTSVHDGCDKADIRFGVKDAPNSFVPVCEMGICSASENQDAAAEFIRTALSSDVQTADTGDGLPVNKKSLTAQMTPKEDETYMNMIVDDEGCERYLTVSSPDEAEQAQFIDYLGSAAEAVRLDAQTKEDIVSAGAGCLTGDLTLDDAVKRIMDKLELRMKE